MSPEWLGPPEHRVGSWFGGPHSRGRNKAGIRPPGQGSPGRDRQHRVLPPGRLCPSGRGLPRSVPLEIRPNMQRNMKTPDQESWGGTQLFAVQCFLNSGASRVRTGDLWRAKHLGSSPAHETQGISHNVPAVAKPAQTCLLKYCCFRNHATEFCFSLCSWPVGSEAAAGGRSRQQLC